MDFGPVPLILLLRSEDELNVLRKPIPEARGRPIAGCLALLALIMIPISVLFSYRIGYYILGFTSVLFGIAWLKREQLRSWASRLARKQIEEAGLAAEALPLFGDPQFDDAFLGNLLVGQSDGADLIRPPGHPIYPMVKRLLSRMDAQGASTLLPKHRNALARFLDPQQAENHEVFINVILDTIAKFGDRSYVRAVNALATKHYLSFEGKRSQEAAGRCLDAMEDRFEREKTARRLLRPSQSSETESATLLHPAQIQEEDSELLLRTAETEPEP